MKYHLKSKASHWDGDDLKFVWCVTDSNGERLTPWMSQNSANSELGKILAIQRRSEK